MIKFSRNELEECMARASQDPNKSIAFYDMLLKSDIYFLPHTYQRQFSTDEQIVDTSVSKTISIRQICVEGKTYIPFFSSVDKIVSAIPSGATYYKISSVVFFKMVKDSPNPQPLMLNPNSECGKIFSLYEVEVLGRGENPAICEERIVPAGNRLLIGQPNIYPYELVDALKKSFKQDKDIKRAFLLHIFDAILDKNAHTLIVIDAEHNFASIANRINTSGIPIPDPPVDATQFYNDPQDPISSYCFEIEPFYTRDSTFLNNTLDFLRGVIRRFVRPRET